MSSLKIRQSGVYFKNLNAIRFIAAFVVVIHHIEQFKYVLKLKNYWSNPTILIIGELGVILFFVLSGFLITYLLFKEKEITNNISIKKFYIRRILRIWPLYFLIIFLAFFIIPQIPFFDIENFRAFTGLKDLFVKLFLYSFFLPNLVLILGGVIPFATHLWSIGVEEQFYLVWPVLNKYIKNKLYVILGVIFLYLVLKFFFLFLNDSNSFQIINLFIQKAPIDCMAIGGFFALVIYEKSAFFEKIKKIIFSKVLQVITLVFVCFLIYSAIYIPYFHYEFYSVLFGILLCNFAANDKVIFSLEHKYTNYLGKISYGLYMFHPIIIFIVIKFSIYLNIPNNYFIYPLVFILTILISSLSYDFFEKKFIDKKIKFSDILSGENAKIN